jgi:hypothetical protein
MRSGLERSVREVSSLIPRLYGWISVPGGIQEMSPHPLTRQRSQGRTPSLGWRRRLVVSLILLMVVSSGTASMGHCACDLVVGQQTSHARTAHHHSVAHAIAPRDHHEGHSGAVPHSRGEQGHSKGSCCKAAPCAAILQRLGTVEVFSVQQLVPHLRSSCLPTTTSERFDSRIFLGPLGRGHPGDNPPFSEDRLFLVYASLLI